MPNPVAVRYAWADNPECNLYGANNLPVIPFRTDSWISPRFTSYEVASYWLKKAYFAEPKPPDVVVLGGSQLIPIQGADSYSYDRLVDPTGDHRSHVMERDLKKLCGKPLSVLIGSIPRQ